MYGCETVTLREENKSVFENRGVLRRILCPKMDEVTGGWKKIAQ
jgi:hypothetical protein